MESHGNLVFFALLCAGLILGSGCREDLASAAIQAREVHKVHLGRIVKAGMEETIPVTGTLMAHDRATLSVKVPGRLDEISVDLGSAVKKGEVIAQISKIDFEMKRQQADAALRQAEARVGIIGKKDEAKIDPDGVSVVREASAVLAEAAKTRERVKSLNQQGIVPQAEIESSETDYQVAAMKYEQSREEARNRVAMLAQRRAELQSAEQELSDTTIRAPFDGVIEARRASPGEFLNIGAPVVTLVDIDPVRFRMEIPERDAPKIRQNQPVRLQAEGGVSPHIGLISRLSPVISSDSRLFLAEADFENKDGALRPGSFVRADIIANANAAALLAPTNALVSFAGIEKLFLVHSGKIDEKDVVTGRVSSQGIEILSGANEGDVVVLDPGNLKSGDSVTAASEAVSKPGT